MQRKPLLFVSSLFTMAYLSSPLTAAEPNTLKGKIVIDGSSTVFPIAEAVAEEFGKVQKNVKVTVGISGTGGGFKRFTTGETDISNASRPIKESEAKAAQKNKVEYHEMKVGYDGLTVVINKSNSFVKKLTVAQLNLLWKPDSKISTWDQLDPAWPKETIKLYGPGTDSGTFDFFTEVINGKSQVSRADFTKSEDDNVLVKGVVGDKNSLGYFGYAYYLANKDKLTAVPIDNGKGQAVGASPESIKDGTYSPLSRPLYIYISKKASEREDVKAFIEFYLAKAETLVKDTGYIPLQKAEYENEWKKFATFAGIKTPKS